MKGLAIIVAFLIFSSVSYALNDSSVTAQAQITQATNAKVVVNSGWVPFGGMCQVDGCLPPYECVKNKSTDIWGKCGTPVQTINVTNVTNKTNVSVNQPITVVANQNASNATVTAPDETTDNLIFLTVIIAVIIISLYFLFRNKKGEKHEEKNTGVAEASPPSPPPSN